jgi:hypothetical protein
VNAAPIEVICLFDRAPVIEAVNRHVMERTFSFDIPGDSRLVNDCPAPTPLSIFAITLST